MNAGGAIHKPVGEPGEVVCGWDTSYGFTPLQSQDDNDLRTLLRITSLALTNWPPEQSNEHTRAAHLKSRGFLRVPQQLPTAHEEPPTDIAPPAGCVRGPLQHQVLVRVGHHRLALLQSCRFRDPNSLQSG